MAAPGHSDFVYKEPTDANPANDTDPYGGAMTSTVIADNALDKTINAPVFAATGEPYYGIFYVQQLASGELQNARLFNRCALKLNTTSGLLTLGFENGSDSGKKIWVQGLVGGILLEEYITCPSAAGLVSGVRNYDSNGILFAEFVNSSNVSDVPVGPITFTRGAQVLGVMKGTGSDPSGKSLAIRQLYSFGKLALATAINTAISGTNRKTAPASGISAFGQGASWSGLDESLPVPGGTLTQNDYIGVCYTLDELPAGLATPAYGRLQIAVNVRGNAVP